MPCYHPLKGWRSKELNPTGKRSIVFTFQQAQLDMPVELPCGQCIGCRLERSRRWAVRCMHENTLHSESSFLTLTYSPENLPPDGSLVLSDFQNFMKRLRKRCGSRLRFFHCGEYGEKFSRPHYHCILFGWDFPDKVKESENHDGFTLSRSPLLEEIWGKGFCLIGAVSFESVAYVARYITKKMTGPAAELYYNDIDTETGEIHRELRPEYVTMSRRPGIGSRWFEKFKTDLYPDDFVLVPRDGNFVKCKIPKYYDQLLEKTDPDLLNFVLYNRRQAGEHSKVQLNNSADRLAVREEIHLRKAEQLNRSYESEVTSVRRLR